MHVYSVAFVLLQSLVDEDAYGCVYPHFTFLPSLVYCQLLTSPVSFPRMFTPLASITPSATLLTGGRQFPLVMMKSES